MAALDKRTEVQLWDAVGAARDWIEKYAEEYCLLLSNNPEALAEALHMALPLIEEKYGSSSREAAAVREQIKYLRESLPSPGASNPL